MCSSSLEKSDHHIVILFKSTPVLIIYLKHFLLLTENTKIILQIITGFYSSANTVTSHFLYYMLKHTLHLFQDDFTPINSDAL